MLRALLSIRKQDCIYLSSCQMVGLFGIFKWHAKTKPFGIQPLFVHLNTRLVGYLDPHCILFPEHYELDLHLTCVVEVIKN